MREISADWWLFTFIDYFILYNNLSSRRIMFYEILKIRFENLTDFKEKYFLKKNKWFVNSIFYELSFIKIDIPNNLGSERISMRSAGLNYLHGDRRENIPWKKNRKPIDNEMLVENPIFLYSRNGTDVFSPKMMGQILVLKKIGLCRYLNTLKVLYFV